MKKNLIWNDLLKTKFDDPTIQWQDFHSGVDIFPLYDDGSPGCSSALLRYHPGARIPKHLHVGTEFLFILWGSQTDERGHYEAGSFLINSTDTSHEILSEEGCIVLAIWEKPVQFIGDNEDSKNFTTYV